MYFDIVDNEELKYVKICIALILYYHEEMVYFSFDFKFMSCKIVHKTVFNLILEQFLTFQFPV